MRLILVALLAILPTVGHAEPLTLLNQPMTLDLPEGQLHGSLLLPRHDQPVPVALLIAGSGPTDRNGNQPGMHNDSLKRLAQALAPRGIASLRYDKRGVGQSQALALEESQLTLDHYVEDAQAWARHLKGDARFSSLILIGHSEGALIASLVAPAVDPAAVVSIAGSGRPIGELLRQQLQGRLPPPLLANAQFLIDELEAGRAQPDVPQPLQVLFRPSVQPYLISLFRRDPAQAFAAVRAPALIVQGTHDIQVNARDAQALKSAKPDATLAMISGMNHVLRIAPQGRDEQTGTYNEPERPLARGLTTRIVSFLQAQGILPSSS
ncbi:alpha/beta hydrolase [Stutzerimonas chloritidismutans]|uniref:alpha/beta hydrolase n=1 Tax=Stutzerimonas chloritidismutans TaxID=203192 RepID=UPI003F15027A